jgi:YHS domain-containing protein
MRSFILLLSLILLPGCVSPGDRAEAPATPASSPSPMHAQCLVCKYNADLACIDVTVDQTTPRYEYGGKTYYFCSQDCRQKFAKNPQKYLKD